MGSEDERLGSGGLDINWGDGSKLEAALRSDLDDVQGSPRWLLVEPLDAFPDFSGKTSLNKACDGTPISGVNDEGVSA